MTFHGFLAKNVFRHPIHTSHEHVQTTEYLHNHPPESICVTRKFLLQGPLTTFFVRQVGRKHCGKHRRKVADTCAVLTHDFLFYFYKHKND